MCRAHGCESTEYIDAHIIPRGFARDMMGDNTHNLLISKANVRPTQHGVYDRQLLCATCDGVLGDLDNAALHVCRRFPNEHKIIAGDCFTLANVDGDTFAKFVLSVLWRASISTRPEFASVSLGPYQAIAGEVVFGARQLTDIPSYQLMVGRYRAGKGFDPARNYSAPARSKYLDGLKGWGFSLHGFKIMAKLDKRPLPTDLHPAIVNGNTQLTGAFVDYLSTVEGRAVLDMAAAQRARRQARQQHQRS
jgi:hypothetical protein